MKQNIKIFLLVFVLTIIPLGLALAQGEAEGEVEDFGTVGNINDFGTVGSVNSSNHTIESPIKCTNVQCFVRDLLNIVVQVGTPILVLAVIYSGFLFVTAQGNESKLATAKGALQYTLIGAAIVLGAFVIAEIIQGTVDQLRG